jgi:hypothetical protein
MIALSLYGSWKQYRQGTSRDQRAALSNGFGTEARDTVTDRLAGPLSLFGAGVGGVCMAFELADRVGSGAVT